jgi:hypothetical protein
MTASSLRFIVRATPPPPPPCQHHWRRRPDLDPNVCRLAYRCELCGALGQRRFGTNDAITIVEPRARDFYTRGRLRTERDRRVYTDRFGNAEWTREEHLFS